MEAPEFLQPSYCSQTNGPDHFIVEDLLDFANIDAAFDSLPGSSTDSTVTVVDSCNSSSFSGSEPNFPPDIAAHRNFTDAHLSADLCVPYDDIAELEWLSNFVEESFSSYDLQKLQLTCGVKTRPEESSETQPNRSITSSNAFVNHNNNPMFHPDVSVPAKARSKRSRAAPCNWASRLMVLSPTTSYSSEPEIVVQAPPPPPAQPSTGKKTVKAAASRKKDMGDSGSAGNGEGRRCLHCATDKTPQWRTGPMGPKTLCNACGVRYKSGRLVPEYRPAASPTFVLTKHSNSHRKVMELRRQKELLRAQQQQQFMHHHHQNMVFDVSNGDDYLIHQHIGPDFRQLI